MKTLFAPDSPAAWADLSQAFAMANPVAAFAVVTIACGIFAAWAAK